jgi:hypothetical protein
MGSITLGAVAERTAVLAVACSRCEPAGRYRLNTLIARTVRTSAFRWCCAFWPPIARSENRSALTLWVVRAIPAEMTRRLTTTQPANAGCR